MPRDALRLAIAISATNLLAPLLPDIREDLGIFFSSAGLVVTSCILARRSVSLVMALTAVLSADLLLPALRREHHSDNATSGIPRHGPMRGRRLTLWTAYVGVLTKMFNRHGFRNTLLPLDAGTVLALRPVVIATGVTAMSLVGLAISMLGAMTRGRFGHRRLISTGLIVLALGNLTIPLAGIYVTFLLASVALGFGDVFVGSQTALPATVAGASDRTRVLGRFRAATDAGALVRPPVLASLIDLFGAQTAMVAAALVLVVWGLISRAAVQLDIRSTAAGPSLVTE
jgi:predicted MFS family arabinose efflux permease